MWNRNIHKQYVGSDVIYVDENGYEVSELDYIQENKKREDEDQ